MHSLIEEEWKHYKCKKSTNLEGLEQKEMSDFVTDERSWREFLRIEGIIASERSINKVRAGEEITEWGGIRNRIHNSKFLEAD